MATDEAPVYEFGDFRLDVRERRLLRDGQPIPLTTKVFETLRVLLERSGRLLTKDELMQQLWPDTVVEENNLNHNISVLRRALGEQPTGQRFIETVPRVGYRFVADVDAAGRPAGSAALPPAGAPRATLRQEIRFCTSGDRTRIAYSTVGTGPPLAKAANWLSHIEHEWDSPVWTHWIREICAAASPRALGRAGLRTLGLERGRPLARCVGARPGDRRGCRWASSASRSWVSRRAAPWRPPMRRGIPSASATSCCAAPTARGWRHRADAREIEARTALLNLTRLGWGQNNPAFRQMFTTRFIPDAGAAEMEWFNDLQRVSTSPENAARLMDTFSRLDVRPLLADITVPTIVFHSQHDGVVPFDEGRLLAAGIRGSTFVPLPSRNHLLLEREPAWPIFLRELGRFLGWPQITPPSDPRPSPPSLGR